jgi:hypothetical protein
MAYGISVFNEFGELVVDFNQALVIEQTGTTISSFDLGMTSLIFGGFFQYRGPRSQELYLFSNIYANTQNLLPHHIGTGVGSFSLGGTDFRFPTPLVPETSTYFYQVGSAGLLRHSEHVVDPSKITTTNGQYGLFSMAVTFNNTPLPFIRVDRGTFSGMSGTHGMKIVNENNVTTFDSRADFLTVSEVLFVPKATIQNILENNAVVDLSLRTPVPNCYISSPNHTSFLRPQDLNYRHVRIRQLNDNTLRLSREAIGPNLNSVLLSIYNDTVIVVARNPFA